MTMKGRKHTESAKKKMSDSQKGIPSPNKGKSMSEQQKIKISDAMKGKTSPNKGKSMSEQQKIKISASHKGKKLTEAQKKKMSASMKGKPSRHKGKPHTAKAKKKISDALKGRHAPNKGVPPSEQMRRRVSATHQGIAYDEWEAFACEKKYCPKFNEACKEANREKYGRRCFICGKTEKANGQKLSVHHVDMDKAQGCESNWKLVPLCKYHHATAHNDELIARLGYLINEMK